MQVIHRPETNIVRKLGGGRQLNSSFVRRVEPRYGTLWNGVLARKATKKKKRKKEKVTNNTKVNGQLMGK